MRHLAEQITTRTPKIDATDLQHIVAPDIVKLPRAELIVLLVPMLRCDFKGLFEGIRSAGISVGNDKAGFVESGLLPHTKHGPVTAHDLPRQLQMHEALVCAGTR